MDENNSFKAKALSHIPLDIQRSMLESTKVTTEGVSGILEALAKNTPSASPLPVAPASAPQQEKLMPIAVDGLVINVPADPFKASIVMISYILATMANKDKKIAKILDQFHFQMKDYNGIEIYPISAKQKKDYNGIEIYPISAKQKKAKK
jgi:hypothetical protein